MSCNEIEEELLSIDSMLEDIILKTDICNKNYEGYCINNKIKENMHLLLSKLLISKELLDNTLHEIRFNDCLNDLHNYIDDFIDIDPELSQKITYCKHCGVEKMYK